MSDTVLKSIEFKNFRLLRRARLRLSRCNVLVGPNGSGKTTVLQALKGLRDPQHWSHNQVLSAGSSQNTQVELDIQWNDSLGGGSTSIKWMAAGHSVEPSPLVDKETTRFRQAFSAGIRIYDLEPRQLVAPVQLGPGIELGQDGYGLAAVLDSLRDKQPERFEALTSELHDWMPDFDTITFDVPNSGSKAFMLRMLDGKQSISAESLSQGTVVALAILTLAYLPDPPSMVCFEEIDRGLHPRLLRRVQDALYRLSYPENFGEKRNPVQVVVTTHSPYFLDLFRDHPDEVIICSKTQDGAKFERLSDKPQIDELLSGVQLGDIWYSGILGGVPAQP